MDPPPTSYYPFGTPLRLQTTDPSSAPAPPIPYDDRDIDSDYSSDSTDGFFPDEHFTNDGMMSWRHGRGTAYVPPRPEDLPCPPTSLVDPSYSSRRAARASIVGSTGSSGTRRRSRARGHATQTMYPVTFAAAAAAAATSANTPPPTTTTTGTVSDASASVPTSNRAQRSAPAKTAAPAAPTQRPATAASALLARERECQVEGSAAELQAASTTTTARSARQRAVVEAIAHAGVAPTMRAVRVVAMDGFDDECERERRGGEAGDGRRGREGMLFGAELGTGGRDGRRSRRIGGGAGGAKGWELDGQCDGNGCGSGYEGDDESAEGK